MNAKDITDSSGNTVLDYIRTAMTDEFGSSLEKDRMSMSYGSSSLCALNYGVDAATLNDTTKLAVMDMRVRIAGGEKSRELGERGDCEFKDGEHTYKISLHTL